MKLEALSPLEAGLKKTPSKSTTAPAKVKLFSACQGPKQGFHDSACHACVPCPHPHMHRKGRRLAKAPQVTRCTCPNTLCDWHGKCRECVALHRYHKSHVPFCLQFIIKDRVQALAATVEMETALSRHTLEYRQYRQYVSERDRERAAAAGDCDQ